MKRLRAVLTSVLLVAPLGCGADDGGGNDELGDGDGDPGTTGDGDPTTTGDGDGDPTTTTTGDGDPTTTGDGDGDGDPTTGDGDGDGDPTTGDGDGDPPIIDNSVYTAVVMPGVPDRITVVRVNNDEPTCTHMVLYKPGFDTFDITMPPGWAIEEALVWRQGFCPMNLANPHGLPMTGTGTISVGSWDALMTYPCTLNFDITIDNATDSAVDVGVEEARRPGLGRELRVARYPHLAHGRHHQQGQVAGEGEQEHAALDPVDPAALPDRETASAGPSSRPSPRSRGLEQAGLELAGSSNAGNGSTASRLNTFEPSTLPIAISCWP